MDGRPNYIVLPQSSPSLSSPSPLSPPPTDIPFPSSDFLLHLPLDDDALTTLEKIYLFSRSKATFHRIFIAHALPSYLNTVSPQDAVEYVLPLLSGLAMDEDELVKEALAAELVPLIWWFFTHCQLTPDPLSPQDTFLPSPSTISVQAFTPILGTLLLSSNPLVGGAARYAVVYLLSRMKRADDLNAGDPTTPLYLSPEFFQEEDETEWVTGLFGPDERDLFRTEILQQVVIGIGRLDMDVDHQSDLDHPSREHQQETSNEAVFPSGEDVGQMFRERSEVGRVGGNGLVNPYFPLLASPLSVVSPTNSAVPQASTSSSPSSSSSLDQSQPNIVELASQDHPVEDFTVQDDWIPSAPRPSHRTLPLPRDSTPWSSPDLPDSAHPASTSNSTTESPGEPPILHEGYQNSYLYNSEESESDGQAAVGRLSSMSLMAAVAASGCLGEETEAFVSEVERVGRDPVYWVRREASFALGALAKVVPQEIVICSLLPLFDSLRKDSVSHIRHSALFALPAVLSRLPPKQRYSLALETLLILSTDESATVRSGVLEVLGEVLYTFHLDEGGPPAQLVELFLGRKEDRRVRDGQQSSTDPPSLSIGGTFKDALLESFYCDPGRPLICAFNFPAVALTLGRDRWPELRDVYIDVASDKAFNVRRTLAASLGELAKIIGGENAQRDLVGVWWDSVCCEEEEVRVKAIECVDEFVLALGSDAGANIIQRLVSVWDEGAFKGWKEREAIAKAFMTLARSSGGRKVPSSVKALLTRALEDKVAAVREIAVTVLPEIWVYWSNRTDVLCELRTNLQGLATSTVYRKRMTFVACMQALVTRRDQDLAANSFDDDLWKSVSVLADDTVVGVRIGVARLLGFISGRLHSSSVPLSGILPNLVHRLSQDDSHEVRSYIPDPSWLDAHPGLAVNARTKTRVSNILTFSRPPPNQRPSQPGRSDVC